MPLYYENRIPQLQIANPTFGDDLMAVAPGEPENRFARATCRYDDALDHYYARG